MRGSARRLGGREIRAVMRRPALRSRRVTVYLAPAEGPPGLAVVAGRRIGRAVRRNRAKRIMREAWRAVAPRMVEPADAVLLARPRIETATTNDLVEEIGEMLGRAGLIA